MEFGLRRSGQYMKMARQIFKEEGVPVDITWLGQVESAWKPKAQSWAAASGLWQFVPSTGRRFGLRQTAWIDERNGFEQATRASAKYLKWLSNRYNGNWELAIAAYNTGEGNVDRGISRAGTANFWAVYPYIAQETRNYVPNILATILIAKNPEKYGFKGIRPDSPMAYDVVQVANSTSLQLIAEATDSSVDVIRGINPELRFSFRQ
jgi:membrane-bound lytic murein transglycosylase D